MVRDMTYPQAPWTLKGYGIQTLQLVDVDRVRPLVPAELKIISVLPGKTLGGIYLASYENGSTLTYNELIVVSAIVHQKANIGGWISHIYVDNADSIAGGRSIWGLPKEYAEFTWNTQNTCSVSVQQNESLLCHLSVSWQLPGWNQSLLIPVFSTISSKLLTFNGQAGFKFHVVGSHLEIPKESPFSWLNLSNPMLSFYLNPLHLIANPPALL